MRLRWKVREVNRASQGGEREKNSQQCPSSARTPYPGYNSQKYVSRYRLISSRELRRGFCRRSSGNRSRRPFRDANPTASGNGNPIDGWREGFDLVLWHGRVENEPNLGDPNGSTSLVIPLRRHDPQRCVVSQKYAGLRLKFKGAGSPRPTFLDETTTSRVQRRSRYCPSTSPLPPS